MKQEVVDRRREMLSFHEQGLKVTEWVKLVASKFQMTEDAVKKDWSRRRSWIHLFVKLEDPISLVKKLISDNELLLLDAENLYDRADESREQLQLMWLRLKIHKERVGLLKEMGAFEPIKGDFEHKKRLHIEKLSEEHYPYRKGDRDREIREQALSRSNKSRAYFD